MAGNSGNGNDRSRRRRSIVVRDVRSSRAMSLMNKMSDVNDDAVPFAASVALVFGLSLVSRSGVGGQYRSAFIGRLVVADGSAHVSPETRRTAQIGLGFSEANAERRTRWKGQELLEA